MTYPTDEMVEAAIDAYYSNYDLGAERAAMRAALIAADRAAWRPISEAEASGEDYALVRWTNEYGKERITAQWLIPPDEDETHFRPLPLPPLTPADQAPKARIVAAEVPAPSAGVSSPEGAG